MSDRALRLRQARQHAGYETAAAAVEAFGWNRNTFTANENGNAAYSYSRAKEYSAAFGVRPEWLYEASGPMKPTGKTDLVSIIGYVGADPEGVVLLATGRGNGRSRPPAARRL